jgi:hypothetical protein
MSPPLAYELWMQFASSTPTKLTLQLMARLNFDLWFSCPPPKQWHKPESVVGGNNASEWAMSGWMGWEGNNAHEWIGSSEKEENFGAYFMSHKRMLSCHVDSHFVTLRKYSLTRFEIFCHTEKGLAWRQLLFFELLYFIYSNGACDLQH